MDIVIAKKKGRGLELTENLSHLVGYNKVDVSRSSLLGNPYDMNGDESKRELVVQAFRRYLWECLKTNNDEVLDPKTVAIEHGFGELTISPVWKKPTTKQLVEKLEGLLSSEKGLILCCYCKESTGTIACHGDVIANCLKWLLPQRLKEVA